MVYSVTFIQFQITVNIHASLTYILTAAGVNTIPSMDAIYVLFGTLVIPDPISWALLNVLFRAFNSFFFSIAAST